MEALALAAGIGIENARLHAALGLVAELQSDARQDHLTGLGNRRHWDERLGQELRRAATGPAPRCRSPSSTSTASRPSTTREATWPGTRC